MIYEDHRRVDVHRSENNMERNSRKPVERSRTLSTLQEHYKSRDDFQNNSEQLGSASVNRNGEVTGSRNHSITNRNLRVVVLVLLGGLVIALLPQYGMLSLFHVARIACWQPMCA